MVERVAVNHQVGGSSPSSGAMYYVYVLHSLSADKIYIGQTNNLSDRINRHNAGSVRSTKPYCPWKLIYVEEFDLRAKAMKREKELKSHKGRDFIRGKI